MSVLGAMETALPSLTGGQRQVKPGGGPAEASQDPPWEQGWLWQGSIFSSHRWPAAGWDRMSHCLVTASFLLIPGSRPSASRTGKGTLAVFSGWEG